MGLTRAKKARNKTMYKIIIALLALTLVSCSKPQQAQPEPRESTPSEVVQATDTSVSTEPQEQVQAQSEPFIPTLGDSFHFDGFDIFLGDAISGFKIVDNKYSNNHGKTAVVLPLTILNVNNAKNLFNPLYITVYAPDKTQSKLLGVLFMDSDVYGMGKMMQGGKVETNIHFEYKGNGEYIIEMNNFDVSGYIVIPVEKE